MKSSEFVIRFLRNILGRKPAKNLRFVDGPATVYFPEKTREFLEENVLDKTETGKPNSKTAKREKFVRIAEKRTRNAIKAIRTIGKLGNKGAYDYTDADAKKIVSALSKEVEAVRTRMLQAGGKDSLEFSL